MKPLDQNQILFILFAHVSSPCVFIVLSLKTPRTIFLFNVEVIYGITSGYVLHVCVCVSVCVCVYICMYKCIREGGERTY